jgi:hypothetical protein
MRIGGRHGGGTPVRPAGAPAAPIGTGIAAAATYIC